MNRVPIAPSGTYINSAIGDITTISRIFSPHACCVGKTDCVFRAGEELEHDAEPSEESSINEVQCQLHNCDGVIWVTRDTFALHRLTSTKKDFP